MSDNIFKSEIQLIDSFTPTLKSIISNIEPLLSNLKEIESIDISGINQNNIGNFKEINDNISQAKNAQLAFNQEISNSLGKVTGLGLNISNAALEQNKLNNEAKSMLFEYSAANKVADNINLAISTNIASQLRFNNEIEKSNKLNKQLGPIISNNKTQQDNLNDSIKETSKNLYDIKGFIGDIPPEIINSSQEYSSFHDLIKKSGISLNELSNKFNIISNYIKNNILMQEQFNEKIKSSQNEVVGFIKQLMGVASAYFSIRKGYNELKDGLDIYKDFEVQMATVGAVTNSTAEELSYLNKVALDMSGWYLPEDIGIGMEELARRGWKASDIILGLNDVVNLAIGNKMELGRAAEITSDIIDQFHYSTDQANRVVNVLSYAASNASTDVDLMGNSFAESASLARTFGADIEDVGTIISMMASSAKGSKAGNALKRGLLNMANLTDNAKATLEQLGVDFIDPITKDFKSLDAIIGDLHDSFNDLNGAAKLKAAKDIFGDMGANAWLEVITQGREEFSKWKDEFANMGDVALEQAERILQTTEGLIRDHQSNLHSNWIDFYQGLADEGMLEPFQNILKLIENMQLFFLMLAEDVIYVVGTIIGLFSGVLDFLLPFISTFAIFFGVLLFGVGVTTLLAKAQQILASAMLLNPALFVAAIVFSLIVTLIHLWRTNDEVAVRLVKAWHGVLNFFSKVPVFFWSIAEGILKALTSWGKPALDFMSDVFNKIIGGINKVISALNKLPGVAIKTLNNIDLGSVASKSLEAVKAKKGAAITKAQEAEFKREIELDSFINNRKNRANESSIPKSIKAALSNNAIGKPDINAIPDPSTLKGIDDISKGIGDLNKGVGKGNKKLKGIKNSVDISKEDLKYLRDLGEEKIIERFTSRTIAPEISVEFSGDIDNNTDFDGLVTKLKDKLYEELDNGPEGIYE